ncbi:Wzz/FepE/Etk N-terminal domain-containing protein [Alkalimonas sp. NCh-2]|uniref:Wzz/FepE/Etk N-terminal domain-containing protein n=1 Tax=Alkalimonas sp. NCh-2 TaxID=3144846 RepID=UPI0031F66377
MTTEDSKKDSRVHDDEIDLRELFVSLWKGKWFIIAVTFVFAVGSVLHALNLPNIYKSEVLLAPVAQEQNMRIPGQLGGLAALAGVSLGAGSGADKTTLAIEVLRSREFIGRFIEKYDLFVPVVAAIDWDIATNTLILDKTAFNISTGQWVRDVKPPRKAKPSKLETYEEFMKLFNVSRDASSGMVRLTIEHYSPYLAKEWLDYLVLEINEEMRQRELQEAERSIAYLNEQVASTTLSDARTMLFSLIEEQTKSLMLANVRKEFIFQTIDHAIVPEQKSSPRRALIVIVFTILGGFFASVLVLIFNILFKTDKEA